MTSFRDELKRHDTEIENTLGMSSLCSSVPGSAPAPTAEWSSFRDELRCRDAEMENSPHAGSLNPPASTSVQALTTELP